MVCKPPKIEIGGWRSFFIAKNEQHFSYQGKTLIDPTALWRQ